MNVIFKNAKIKEIFAQEDVQKTLQRHVSVPEIICIKTLRSPFTDETTKVSSQKAEAVSGTCVEDFEHITFTLVGQTLNQDALNQKFRIKSFELMPEANMRGGSFNGYAATGLKLIVKELSPLKTEERHENNSPKN